VADALSQDDAKTLIRFCETGRLYDLEQWIRSGRSLAIPAELKTSLLTLATRTGFHSVIELLLRHEDRQSIKNDALQQALQTRRRDLVELAVGYGAEISSVPFVDVLLSWDRNIVSFFLERGADPVTDAPFAQAFSERIRTALGSYLECKRSRPDLAAQLQVQADIALRYFCREGNLKWVSLLLWAGADPRSHGPTLENLDDPDMNATAFHEACIAGHLDVLKRLKPDPARDDLSDLLRTSAMFAPSEVLSYLLELGPNPNDRTDGSSSALDGCLWRLNCEDFDRIRYGGRGSSYKSPPYRLSNTRATLRQLIEHGAVWKPDPRGLNDVRRTLCQIDPEVSIELIGLLVTHRACDDATLHNLLRTPRIRQHMAASEGRLLRAGVTLEGRRRTEARIPRKPTPSSYVLTRYDREHLYKEIWTEPARRVATRYGVSDVAIAKVCRQLNIPKPPRGYWAKKAAGQTVPRRPRLPRLQNEAKT